MKTYDDYMQEWESIKRTAPAGHNMIVRPDFYVTIHFLEDHGVQEPWKLTPAEYEAMFEGMDRQSRENIEKAMESTFNTFLEH